MSDKYRKIVGQERQTLAKDLVKRYSEGSSVRSLAASTKRSYGFVHNVLTEAGVRLRDRGNGGRYAQLVATLAARYPAQPITLRQAKSTLRNAYGTCSWLTVGQVERACAEHNQQVAQQGGQR